MRVVGLIVAIRLLKGGLWLYTIDDGSGECLGAMVNVPSTTAPIINTLGALQDELQRSADDAAKPGMVQASSPPALYGGLDLGDVVDVKGALSIYRDEKQLRIEKMVKVRSTAQEMALWERRSKFRREVLNRPWCLSEKEIRGCRKEAEASEASHKTGTKRVNAISGASMSKSTNTTTKHNSVSIGGRGASEGVTKTEATAKARSRGDISARVRDLIREGSVKGKYSALGL